MRAAPELDALRELTICEIFFAGMATAEQKIAARAAAVVLRKSDEEAGIEMLLPTRCALHRQASAYAFSPTRALSRRARLLGGQLFAVPRPLDDEEWFQLFYLAAAIGEHDEFAGFAPVEKRGQQ